MNILIFIFLLEIILRLFYFYKKNEFLLFINSPFRSNNSNKRKTLLYQKSVFRSYEKKPNIYKGFFISNNYSFTSFEDTSLIKEKNCIRIFILGGSTAEQKFNESSEVCLSWPELLEAKLKKKYPQIKFEIINSSNSGYTIIDNNLDLLTKCIFFKPDFVFIYANINDSYLQPHPEFKYDYSHIRIIPKFPKFHWVDYIPHLRFSFISYYLLSFIKRNFYYFNKNLLFYTHKDSRKFKSNYSNIEYPIEVFKSYLRSFYGICLANNAIPIFAPWQFNEELVSNPMLYVEYDTWDKDKYVDLLKKNNQSIFDVAKECGEDKAVYLDLPRMEKDCFNCNSSKNDWQHLSSKGLEKMSEDVFQNLISNNLFNNRLTKK